MRVSTNPFSFSAALVVTVMLLFAACKKEDTYLYEVNPVNVQTAGSQKTNVKTTTEFISIAYTDLFAKSIAQADLMKLNTVYVAFGDKKLIEDRIIRNFLTKPGVQIPTLPSVNGDTAAFVTKTYRKFYNRDPDAFEAYYLKEQIRLNTAMTPLVIYYTFMTSDEYRYY